MVHLLGFDEGSKLGYTLGSSEAYNDCKNYGIFVIFHCDEKTGLYWDLQMNL